MSNYSDKDIVDPISKEDKGKSYDVEQTNKITDWQNQPSIEDIKADMQEAQPFHDRHVNEVKTWLDNMHIRGKAKPKTKKGKSEYQPKLIRKQAEWRYASLSEPFLSPEDLFTASPATADDTLAAKQNGVLLNYQIRNQSNFTKFIDDYVRTAVDEGTVICRVSWEREEKEVTKLEPTYQYIPDNSPGVIQKLKELRLLSIENPDRFEQLPEHVKQAFQLSMESGVPVNYYQDAVQEVSKTIVTKNHPIVEVCEYDDVIIDPTCRGDLTKAKFIFFRFPTSKAELRKAGIYKNIDNIVEEDAKPTSQFFEISIDDTGIVATKVADPASKKNLLKVNELHHLKRKR